MSAVYWNKKGGNKRLTALPSASMFFAACRIVCNVHWRWDDDRKLYQTHRWSGDARYTDVRDWPGETALSSLLAAVRGDDRMAGDPLLRLMAGYITLEYLTSLMEDLRL